MPKTVIVWNNEPYIVIASHVFRKQQRKPVNQTKLRSVRTGKVIEQTFHQNETAEEADISYRPIELIYRNRGEYVFCPPGKQGERTALLEDVVGEQGKFIKPKTTVEAMVYNEDIIGIRVPIKVELSVQDAPPAVKGNTAQGGVKQVTLETGATINVPMFINEGDIVRINTESGEYAERVRKA